MKLRARLMRTVSGPCGPANRNILRGIARAHGYAESFEGTLRAMLKSGELVMYGKRKGAVYGAPKRRPR